MRRTRLFLAVLCSATLLYIISLCFSGGVSQEDLATRLLRIAAHDLIPVHMSAAFSHRPGPSPLYVTSADNDTGVNTTAPASNQSQLASHDMQEIQSPLQAYLTSLAQLWPFSQSSSSSAVTNHATKDDQTSLPQCTPFTSLGPVFVPTHVRHLKGPVLTRYSRPRLGGVWFPEGCRPVSRVAVLVPYRKREDNLLLFTHHMHYFLQQQQLHYTIFIIEQLDEKRFNRAKLFNIGFLLALQMNDAFDCFVLHDIDKIPEDTRFLYHCDKQHPKQMPHWFRHLSAQEAEEANLDQYMSSKAPSRQEKILNKPNGPYTSAHFYQNYFGGVTALSRDQYMRINGMTNEYWGWGGEDDELICRVRARDLEPVFSQEDTSRFVVLPHAPDAQYSRRPLPNCKKVAQYMAKDGLNSLSFELHSIAFQTLYTHIRVLL